MRKKARVSIPRFPTEAEESTFWESHDSSDFVDWSKATKAVMPNLKLTLPPKTPLGQTNTPCSAPTNSTSA